MHSEGFPPPEFSRPVPVDQLPSKVSRRSIEAEPGERAALAERLGLVELTALSAKIELEPLARSGFIRVNGRLTARVVQSCVVTLAPLAAVVEEEFELTFAPPPKRYWMNRTKSRYHGASKIPRIPSSMVVSTLARWWSNIWLWRSTRFPERPERHSNRRRRSRRVRTGGSIPSRCCRRCGKNRGEGKHSLALGGLFG